MSAFIIKRPVYLNYLNLCILEVTYCFHMFHIKNNFKLHVQLSCIIVTNVFMLIIITLYGISAYA